MAEVQAVGNAVAGQTSGTSGRADHRSINIEDNYLMAGLSESMREMLKDLDDDSIENNAGDQKPKIPRVPKELRDRENIKKYLEPRVVSIGPYHHNDPKFNLKVNQDMKIKLARMFIREHRIQKEQAFCSIKEEIRGLKSRYEPDATQDYSDEYLAWMFFIDGCVVLHFIYGFDKSREKYKGLEILLAVTDKLTFQMDIMLLENQLPYQVLDKLIIGLTEENDRKQLKKSIQEFILQLTYRDQEEKEQELDLKASFHLLDLMRTSFTSTRTVKKSSCIWWIIEKSFTVIGMPFRILTCIISKLVDILPHKHTVNVLTSRNIEELVEAGVKFKLTDTGSLTDIKFSNGTLKLPLIVVNKVTSFKFLNLIAYEISAGFPHKFEVSSFIFFLASLMRQPRDVKELRVNRILHNYLDSDKEVFELFKEIRTDDLEDAFVNKYSDILKEIQKHCNRRYNVWMAQLEKRYFQSPWTAFALLGAISLFVLTLLQTIYTIKGYRKQ